MIHQFSREEVEAFDAEMGQECTIKTCIDVVVADYAMMSFCANHLGAAAKKYCPRCFVCCIYFYTFFWTKLSYSTLKIINITITSLFGISWIV